jgi:YD repeat-containing protein
MVAIVAGNGLGLFNASLNSLGGAVGQGSLGQSGGQALVNAHNGNLILQFTDEQLSGLGRDLLHLRTYNTQGALNDADADGWRWDGERRVVLSGTRNTAGSTLTRATGDGHEAVYVWTGTRYQSNAGDGAHDSLQWDAATSEWLWVDGSRRTEERYAGDSGRLLSTVDAAGTRIHYGYDAAGRLASVKDSSGQELVLVYNAAGKLERLDTRTTEGGALTRQVYYTYDAQGRLSGVYTDLTPADNSIADGQVYTTAYTYDGTSFRIASVTQSDGTSVSFTYQLVGADYRVKTVTDASGTSTFDYDTVNRRTDVTNGLGQQWSYFYDAADQLIEVQSPAVNGQRLSTRYAYDADGNVLQVTDGRGNTVTYGYDVNGNRTLERDARGNTVTRTFSASNQLLNEIRYSAPATWNAATSTWTEPPASAAQVTRYAYDGNQRLRFVIDATGNVSEYRYNANGLRSHEISYGDAPYSVTGLAPTATLSELEVGMWAVQRDPMRARLTEMVYDYRGNLSLRIAYATVNASGNGVIDAAGIGTQYIYSEHGQLLQSIALRGETRTNKYVLSSALYDGMGRMLGQIDSNGLRTYVNAHRATSTTNAAGLTVIQTYDAQGRLLSVSETAAGAVSRTTQYAYDAAGRRTMVQDATGVRTYTFYDEAGRVSAQVDGTGAVTEYGYDAAGQRTLVTQYATLVDTSSWYNGTAVTKTLVGQIRPAATAADRSKTYAYNEAGQLSSSTDAAGVTTTYTYDGRGQLITQQTGSRITRTFYDAAGRQTGQLDGEGYLRENIYNAAGQLIQVIRYASATAPAERASGTLEALRPASGDNLSTWYFYDNAGRQIGSVDEQQFVSETIYDEASNTQQSIRYATAYTAAIDGTTPFNTIKAAVASGAKQSTLLAYDSMGRLSQRTATDGTVTAYEYDASGRLIRETSAHGTSEARSSLTRYDAFGQVTGKLLGEASARITAGMTDEQIAAVYAQHGLTYAYDPLGRVASVTDAAGNRTSSYYDAAGRLTHVINALGEISETVYSAFGEVSERAQLTNRLSTADTASLTGGLNAQIKPLMQAIRNAATDNRSTYAYDKRGLLSSSTDALGYITSYGYNDFGEQSSITRSIASGQTVTQSLSYNQRGELIGRIEDVGGLARSTATVYDAFGRVISQIDGRGLTRTTAYASNGRIITVKNPLNQGQSSEYDAFGRVLSQTDALGKTTTYSYDDNTRTVVVTTPDGVSVSTVKNRHGQTLTVTDGTGAITRYSYNQDGQLLSTTDALNQVKTNTYDAAGRLLSSIDALGRETTYGYDAANRVVTRTDAHGSVTRYTFDGQGRQVRVTTADGLPEQRITDYAYDRKGQTLTVTQDPNGLKLTTTYSYDGLGQQVQVARGTVANPNQQITQYVFDKLGRRTAEYQDPNGLNLTTQYRYNENDQVTRKIDAAGNSTWYVYDTAGRLADTVDALGGVTRNVYDANGRVTSSTRYATAIAVAALGDAPMSVSPVVNAAKDQTTHSIYDDLGRVRYTINALNQVSETLYDNAGRILETRQYSQAIAAATPRTLAATAAALTTAGAQARTTSYVYDAAGQLKSVTDAAGKIERYTYDAVGNRKTLTNKNGAVWTYNYDSLNRLVEEVTPAVPVATISDTGVVSTATRYLVTRISYDALGNVTSRSTGRLRTNAGNDPALDDLSQARTTTYAYDSVGRQILTTAPGWYHKTSGQYRYAADAAANTFQVSTEVTYDALGNAVRNRVRVNNTGVAATDFVDSFKVYDVLGRVTHDIDALKGVTAYSYDALGNVVTTTRHNNALTKALPALGYYLKADITSATLIPDASFDRTLTTSYDALGRKTAVQQNHTGIYTFTGNAATSTLITAAPTTLYSYNALGQLVRETQVARNTSGATVLTGASTVHYYDRAGQRIGSVDALGHYTRMEYDALGQLARQVEYATKLTSWNENTLPTAPAANNADRSTRFAYDGMGRVLQTTRENVLYWQQDASNLNGVVTATEVRGNVIDSRLTYDNVGNIQTATDALGNVTTTEYNALGQVSKLIEPARWTAKAGAVNPHASDFSGLMMASPTISYLVNAFGQIIREIRAAGTNAAGDVQAGLSQTTRTRYDAAGYEIQEIDAAGSAQDYKVDVAGRRIEESRQISVTMGAWWLPAFGVAMNMNHSIRRTFEYDKLGQQTATVDWYTEGWDTKTSMRDSALYNRFGEVTHKQLNGNNIEIFNYDRVGRVESHGNAASAITVFNYDLSGKVSKSTVLGDWGTTADDRITYMRNDLLGRTLEQHLPAFEANLNADTLNNINLTLTTPIIRQSVDRWGNVVDRTDARGQSTFYSYNHNNQLYDESLPPTDILRENGTSYRTILLHKRGYDAVGNLILQQDYLWPYAGVSNFTLLRTRQHVFNQVGELTRDIDALGYTRAYLTDAHGNRVATRDALGTVTVDSYDAMDRHTSHGILRNGTKVTLLTNQYDQAGRLYGEISGTSAVEETLNSVANTATWSNTTTGVMGNTRYTAYNERGNITWTRNESGVAKQFEYDTSNHKVKETDGLNNTLTWTYTADGFGRLASRKDLAGRVYTYTYNGFNQVTKETVQVPVAGSTPTAGPEKTYTYYQNGLTKSIVEGYFTRDAANTLIGESSRSSSYSYDVAGNRVREINSGKFIYGGTGSTSAEVRFRYDEKGRLKEVKAPAGNQYVGGDTPGHWGYSTVSTARIDSLKYDYDELGNRRRVYLDTTNQSGTRKTIDDWYKYDLEDRVLIAEGYLKNGQIVAGTVQGKSSVNKSLTVSIAAKGYAISYDVLGRRQTSESWQKAIYEEKRSGGKPVDWNYWDAYSGDTYLRSTYTYNDLGQVSTITGVQLARAGLSDTSMATKSIIGGEYYKKVTYAAVGTARTLFSATHDDRGNRTQQSDYSYNWKGNETSLTSNTSTVYKYRGDAQALSQLKYKSGKLTQANYFNETGMLDAAGNQTGYRFVVYTSSGGLDYRGVYASTYALFDSYKEASISAKQFHQSGTAKGKPGTTTFTYSDRGELMQAVATGGAPFTRRLASNREGQLIARQESSGKVQNYLYYQGRALANVGNASTPEITDTFTPISPEYPGRTPGNYVVSEGDTLEGIAHAVWGDGRMWYLIADANGLDPSVPLITGDSLKIPNVVSSTHNDATTFKPYNPDDVIGNTTPSPKPPKPKKKKCGGIAAIVMVVVAVVVTVFTAGAATGALAAGFQATMSAGMTALAGGTAAAGAIGMTAAAGISVGTAIGASVVGAAVGSIASQVAGKAMGVVDKFSWRQVAASGLTAGLTSGLGAAANVAQQGSWARTAAEAVGSSYSAQGVFNYASSQAINRIVGLDTSFSWSGLAASVAGANIGGYVGNSTGIGGMPGAMIKGQISAHASAAMNDKWFGGSRPNYGQVAADAFGNTLANFAVSTLANDGKQTAVRQAMDKANIPYSVNKDGTLQTASAFTQKAIENLVSQGYSAEDIGTVLSNPGIRERALTQARVLDDGRVAYLNEYGAESYSTHASAPLEWTNGGTVPTSAPSENRFARLVNVYGQPLVDGVSAIGQFAHENPGKTKLVEIAAQGAYYAVAGHAAIIKDQIIDRTIGPAFDAGSEYVHGRISGFYQENGVKIDQANLAASGTLFAGTMVLGLVGKGVQVAKEFFVSRQTTSSNHIDGLTLRAEFKDGMDPKEFNRKINRIENAINEDRAVSNIPHSISDTERRSLTRAYRRDLQSRIESFHAKDPVARDNALKRLRNSDIDHMLDLQLDGHNLRHNLKTLDSKVNQELGRQFSTQLPRNERVPIIKIDVNGFPETP